MGTGVGVSAGIRVGMRVAAGDGAHLVTDAHS